MKLKRLTCSIVALALSSLCLSSSSDASIRTYSRTDTDKKVIALTFDDGPHEIYTGEILDVLDKYGVKATFFVIGENAKRMSGIVKREAASGHEIENHTFAHEYASGRGTPDIERDIMMNDETVFSITGNHTKLIRPPGGIINKEYEKVIDSLGYKAVLWSVDTGDWRCPGKDYIVSTVVNTVRSGDIILMHDAVYGKSSTPEALDEIIGILKARGFSFVTVSELLGME